MLFSEVRGQLNILTELKEYTPRFIQDREKFIQHGGSDDPYWRDVSQISGCIERIISQGISFFNEHYDFTSEENMLKALPARYKVSASGGYQEYEKSRGVMLCLIRCILGDFEFVRHYRSDDYKTIFPKRVEDLDKIIAYLPQMKKSLQEKGYVSV